mgnify:CR=1 FL=1
MIAFLIKRIFHALLVMFVISVIAFAIQDNLGDPIQQMVGQSVPESEREVLREQLGLNDPFLVQYLRFAGNALQLDFGYSYIFNQPTTEVILRHLPATLELVLATSLLIVLLSVPIGVYSAIRPRAWLSRAFMGVSIIGISIPVFLTAIVLQQRCEELELLIISFLHILQQLESREVSLPTWDRSVFTKMSLSKLSGANSVSSSLFIHSCSKKAKRTFHLGLESRRDYLEGPSLSLSAYPISFSIQVCAPDRVLL